MPRPRYKNMIPKLIVPRMHATIISASIVIMLVHYLKSQNTIFGHMLLSPTVTTSCTSDFGWSYIQLHAPCKSLLRSTFTSRHCILRSLRVPCIFPLPVGTFLGSGISGVGLQLTKLNKITKNINLI